MALTAYVGSLGSSIILARIRLFSQFASHMPLDFTMFGVRLTFLFTKMMANYLFQPVMAMCGNGMRYHDCNIHDILCELTKMIIMIPSSLICSYFHSSRSYFKEEESQKRRNSSLELYASWLKAEQ